MALYFHWMWVESSRRALSRHVTGVTVTGLLTGGWLFRRCGEAGGGVGLQGDGVLLHFRFLDDRIHLLADGSHEVTFGGEFKAGGRLQIKHLWHASEVDDIRNRVIGISRRLESQTELIFLTQTPTVSHLPVDVADDALLKELLDDQRLGQLLRQKREEVIADDHRVEAGAGGLNLLTVHRLRRRRGLGRRVGGGDGRIEGANEGERQRAEECAEFHSLDLVWFVHRLPSAYSDQSVN